MIPVASVRPEVPGARERGVREELVKSAFRRLAELDVPYGPAAKILFGGLYVADYVVVDAREWALSKFVYGPLLRSQCVSLGRDFNLSAMPDVRGQVRLQIGDHCMFSDFHVRGLSGAGAVPRLTIGNGCHFGSRVVFSVACGIDVGDHVLIAGSSSVADNDEYDQDGEANSSGPTAASASSVAPATAATATAATRSERAGSARPASGGPKPIVLESYAWLGRNAHVMKGVRVGRGAIVAAGSVVNQDVPAGALAMGVPARILKR